MQYFAIFLDSKLSIKLSMFYFSKTSLLYIQWRDCIFILQIWHWKYVRNTIFNLQLWELVFKSFKFIKGLHHTIFPDKTLCIAVNELEMEIYALSMYVVTFTLISILVTDYIQKRRGQALLFSFEYNLLLKLISK